VRKGRIERLEAVEVGGLSGDRNQGEEDSDEAVLENADPNNLEDISACADKDKRVDIH
jgi:hypothetical protein